MLLAMFIWLLLKHFIPSPLQYLRQKCHSYDVINLEMFANNPFMICLELTTLNFMFIQLFHFDVHEDVRTIADATIEKDEVLFYSRCNYLFEIQVYKTRFSLRVLINLFSIFLLLVILISYLYLNQQSHAGKVVERHWYEKNKHIFPASRWEVLCFSLTFFNMLRLDCLLHVVAAYESVYNCFRCLLQIYDPTKKWERYTIHGD